jgi:hypothetical protein
MIPLRTLKVQFPFAEIVYVRQVTNEISSV